jgi:hypothetical protein
VVSVVVKPFLFYLRVNQHKLCKFKRYDRNKLTPKDIHNCQYVACMNPTAGSFTINPRLQVTTVNTTGFMSKRVHKYLPNNFRGGALKTLKVSSFDY